MNRGKPIRVLLASMPALLIDIVSEIVRSGHGMVIAGRPAEGETVLAAVRRTRSDVIVVAETEENARQAYAPLMCGKPGIRVVAIAGNGRTGQLYELRPMRIALGELSVEALRDAIRDRHAK